MRGDSLQPAVRHLWVRDFFHPCAAEFARCGLPALLVTLCPWLAFAQGAGAQGTADSSSQVQDPQTIFPHSNTARWWISGQVNTILQGHPAFPAPYSGPHSLDPRAEIHDSRVLT